MPRSIIPPKLGYPLRQEVFSTWWHGKMPTAPQTWASRNISSTTDNAAGDITLTFQLAYLATPAAILTVGDQVSIACAGTTALSSSSARFVTISDFGAVLTEVQKVSAAFVGDL